MTQQNEINLFEEHFFVLLDISNTTPEEVKGFKKTGEELEPYLLEVKQ